MTGKTCPQCQEYKNGDCFPKRSNGTLRSWCYSCCRIKDRERRPRTTPVNPLMGRDRQRDYHFRHKFGISLEVYNKMFENQEGRCAICKAHQTEFNKSLAVDHCHETNEVRGLLCFDCNTALGKLGDNKESIEKVLEYLS